MGFPLLNLRRYSMSNWWKYHKRHETALYWMISVFLVMFITVFFLASLIVPFLLCAFLNCCWWLLLWFVTIPLNAGIIKIVFDFLDL